MLNVVCNNKPVIRSTYRYDALLVGKQEVIQLNKFMTALFALFKGRHMCCIHCEFCKTRRL